MSSKITDNPINDNKNRRDRYAPTVIVMTLDLEPCSCSFSLLKSVYVSAMLISFYLKLVYCIPWLQVCFTAKGNTYINTGYN